MEDFMPISGCDHLECYVGNGTQGATVYEHATIATYGETVHTFVNRADYAGAYLPGYVASATDGARGGAGLRSIDHVVGNVELGRMNSWVEFYEHAFGMTELLHFSDEAIQ